MGRMFSLMILGWLPVLGLAVGCGDGGGSGQSGTECPGGKLDTKTNLCWQHPIEDTLMTWQEALDYCDSLDKGSSTDWRLPTLDELRSLVVGCAFTITGGSCGLCDGCAKLSCGDDSCNGSTWLKGPSSQGCYWSDELNSAAACFALWSSTAVTDDAEKAFSVNFGSATIVPKEKEPAESTTRARCVRTMTP